MFVQRSIGEVQCMRTRGSNGAKGGNALEEMARSERCFSQRQLRWDDSHSGNDDLRRQATAGDRRTTGLLTMVHPQVSVEMLSSPNAGYRSHVISSVTRSALETIEGS